MIWVCEYSPAQKALHVDTLERVLEANRRTIEQGVEPGFIPIYAGATSEDAHAFSMQWQREHLEGGRDGS